MRINVHAGHAPDGGAGCGAVGIGYESTMNRQVKDHLISLLRQLGHTVYDCTVNENMSARQVLEGICAMCNSHEVDLDVSIHHNACVQDFNGDGKTTGTLCYIYSEGSAAAIYAGEISKNISALGYRNMGSTVRKDLYYLNHTKAPAVLVECCFVDDRDDMNLWNAQDMAYAIAYGIDLLNVPYNWYPAKGQEGPWYKVQVGAFKNKEYAQALLQEIKNAGYQDAFIQTL